MTADHRFIDAHVHTEYSRNDCQQPMEEILDLVRNGTLLGVGFADHLHPISEHLATQYKSMKPDRFPGAEYVARIAAAKAEGLNVYAGVEVSYEPEYDALCQARTAEDAYDYRIGSAHSFLGFWVTRTYWQSVLAGPMFDTIVNGYYDALLPQAEVKWIDVIAHIGVYSRFLPDDHALMQYGDKLIEKRERELARALAKSGKIVEVNTSGLFAPGGRTMPSERFLRNFRAFGGTKLCLSSDAHEIAKVNQGFDTVASRLCELGFTSLYYPWDASTPVPLA